MILVGLLSRSAILSAEELTISVTNIQRVLVGTVEAEDDELRITRGEQSETLPRAKVVATTTLDVQARPDSEVEQSIRAFLKEQTGAIKAGTKARGQEGFNEIAKAFKALEGRREELHNRAAPAKDYADAMTEALLGMAIVQSGQHKYDQRAIQCLTRALMYDPLDRNLNRIRHWFVYHVHDNNYDAWPEEDPDPKIRALILAQQKKAREKLQSLRTQWAKELETLRELDDPALLLHRGKALLTRIEQTCKQDWVWTSRAILDTSENPHRLASEVAFLLAETLANQPVFTDTDIDDMLRYARDSLEYQPQNNLNAERLAWIIDFGLVLKDQRTPQ
jgi:hypothetical protein